MVRSTFLPLRNSELETWLRWSCTGSEPGLRHLQSRSDLICTGFWCSYLSLQTATPKKAGWKTSPLCAWLEEKRSSSFPVSHPSWRRVEVHNLCWLVVTDKAQNQAPMCWPKVSTQWLPVGVLESWEVDREESTLDMRKCCSERDVGNPIYVFEEGASFQSFFTYLSKTHIRGPEPPPGKWCLGHYLEADCGFACRNDRQRRTAEGHPDAQCTSLRSRWPTFKVLFLLCLPPLQKLPFCWS